METLALTQRIGGDWYEIDPVTIDGVVVDVYRSQADNCLIEVAVYKGIVHVRGYTDEKQYEDQFENFAEDPDVKKLIQELHAA
jgi:uncharacterized membrane protein